MATVVNKHASAEECVHEDKERGGNELSPGFFGNQITILDDPGLQEC